MKNLILTTMFLSFSALAQGSNCALTPDALKGVLNGRDTEVEGYMVPPIEKRTFKELAVMKDGWKVDYAVGGCAHYTFAFTFSQFGKKNFSTKERILAFAEKMIKKTPTLVSENKDALLQGIEAGKSSAHKIENKFLRLPCGEPQCLIDLSHKGFLKVSYDLAL